MGNFDNAALHLALVGAGTFVVGWYLSRALAPSTPPQAVFQSLDDDEIDLKDRPSLSRRNSSRGGSSLVMGKSAGVELEKLAERFEDFKMVLVVRNDLKMGKGKIAAQCSHASLGLYQRVSEGAPKALARWEEDCGSVKVVVKCESEDEMLLLQSKIRAIGLQTYIVTDAGRTQIPENSRTVMAALGPAHMLDAVTGHLKLM